MPLLSVLAAAPNVGDRQVAEVLHEEQLRYREARRQRDVEPAVAVEEARGGAVPLLVFPRRDEHRHHRLVFRRKEDLGPDSIENVLP